MFSPNILHKRAAKAGIYSVLIDNECSVFSDYELHAKTAVLPDFQLELNGEQRKSGDKPESLDSRKYFLFAISDSCECRVRGSEL